MRKGELMETVYFLGHPDGTTVKIGITDNLRRRLHQLRNPTGSLQRIPWRLLVAVQGERSAERRLHDVFAPFRVRSELFSATDELRGYIRWLYHCQFAIRSEDAEPEPVSSDQWLYRPGRTMPPIFSEPNDDGQLLLDTDTLNDPWRDVTFEPQLTGDDFYTPPEILELARTVIGGDDFDLDPASHPIANTQVRAKAIYTKEDNGLTKPWYGRVWLNPPFGAWKAFAPKIMDEWMRGDIDTMFVLMSSRSMTAQTVYEIIQSCNAVCITHGRLPFWGALAGSSPTDGHAICYFGDNAEGFARAFMDIGKTLYPSTSATPETSERRRYQFGGKISVTPVAVKTELALPETAPCLENRGRRVW